MSFRAMGFILPLWGDCTRPMHTDAFGGGHRCCRSVSCFIWEGSGESGAICLMAFRFITAFVWAGLVGLLPPRALDPPC